MNGKLHHTRMARLATIMGEMSDQSTLYVHYGCGFVAPKEWLNFDASFKLKWEKLPVLGGLYKKNPEYFPTNVRVGNIVHGLPIPDGACSGIYSSHMLNHLALDEFHRAIENTHKMLRPGGIFRCLVPDLKRIAEQYLQRLESGDAAANTFLMEATDLGKRVKPTGLRGLIHQYLRTSEAHWMWDLLSLRTALEKHGFQHIRECAYADCEDPMFRLVETEGRFAGAIALEARR